MSERVERQAMFERLIATLPPNSERMFKFISNSAALAGSHTRHAPGPVSTIGFRVHGTVVDEILPWGEWAALRARTAAPATAPAPAPAPAPALQTRRAPHGRGDIPRHVRWYLARHAWTLRAVAAQRTQDTRSCAHAAPRPPACLRPAAAAIAYSLYLRCVPMCASTLVTGAGGAQGRHT